MKITSVSSKSTSRPSIGKIAGSRLIDIQNAANWFVLWYMIGYQNISYNFTFINIPHNAKDKVFHKSYTKRHLDFKINLVLCDEPRLLLHEQVNVKYVSSMCVHCNMHLLHRKEHVCFFINMWRQNQRHSVLKQQRVMLHL